MNKRHALRLARNILYCQLAGVVSSLFTIPSVEGWYTHLNKPSFIPPGWISGPIGLILFTLMGIALYRIDSGFFMTNKKRVAEIAFHVQLALHVGWSVIFFALQSPFAAFIEVIVLLLAAAAAIHFAYRVDRPSGWLLFPYLLWICYATVLTYWFWQLN